MDQRRARAVPGRRPAGKRAGIRAGLLAAWAAASLLGAPGLSAQDNELCFSCHGQGAAGIPHVSAKEFGRSIHRRNLCLSCHADASDIPHPAKLAPVACGACHRIETEIYLNSDHGRALSRGVSQAATCTSCHGKTHTLLSSRDPLSPVHRRNIPNTCAVCHADQKKMAEIRLTEKEPFDTYLHSIHGIAFKEGKLNAAVCSDCHGTHDLHASSNPESKIFRSNVPQTCGKCHENVLSVFRRSIHGKAMSAGIKEAPVCTDCHGEHTIRAVKDEASSVWAGAITKTCARCHDSERIVAKFGLPPDRLKSFQDSYHGLASRAGDLRVANCASCHGWHDILPSYDTQSSIHPKNLSQTCGKCHPGAQTGLLSGRIHGAGGSEKYFLVRWVEIFYWVIIPLVIGGMLLHNFSDYLRKALSIPSGTSHPHGTGILRMNRNERWQHALLMFAFALLAYSGFSLKYPEAWWASPFQLFGGEELRKSVHRWTALAFTVLGFYHGFYMVLTRRGRHILWHRLFPRVEDGLAAVKVLLFNMGIARGRPSPRYPSYVERVEYWALLWGSAVMVLTGSLLAFNDITLRYFPLWVAELATVAHFYEAVLASLAILVWHGYWTVFDPEVYPMNWAWICGKVQREKKN
ncbi:MAG: hypothetical protein A2636_04140 [Elusimicrobia bacterium RIFCSPHIGHO2_01_FULL_64_10]|nr:MAG: hypothetical protein A2636_04140 [Elusimicrobia bacterium RIFCSPHIGHO2_01_FULL_64_10]